MFIVQWPNSTPAKAVLKAWLMQFAYHRAINRRQHLQGREFYKSTELEEEELKNRPGEAHKTFGLSAVEAHLEQCGECRSEYKELFILVTRELPQTQGVFQQTLAEMRAIPLQESRQRFLRRARPEGIVFSREVETRARLSPWNARPAIMLAPIAALLI
jgi:hypothetical protein